MTRPVVEPGRTCLGNRYELGRLLASGGMGQVWEGHDVLLGRPVAVKVLRSEYTGDPTFLARFRAEAQNAAALSHPHIAAVYDYGEVTAEDGSGETLAYLVMELVPGEPLSEALRRSGSLGTERTLTVLAQTAAGLAEAHRAGMVHRDVKPGNLMITSDGDVKITDFGIAWSARSVALTQTGQVIGTPQYLSPEQAEGKQATPASDVYALGLIGYECLTGQPAFDGDNAVTIALKQLREEPEPLPADLPARVRTLVHRAMEKNPDARMPDGGAFLAAVEAVRAGRSIDPAPSTVLAAAAPVSSAAPAASGPAGAGAARGRRAAGPGRVSRPPGRRRKRIAVVLLPLLGLLAGAGIAAMLLQGLAGGAGTPAAEAGQQSQDETVVLEEDDYLGRPAEEVAVQLAALGLTVERELAQRTDAEPGTVVGIDPAGQALAPGDTVILQVAAASGDEGAGTAGGGSAGAGVVAPDSTPGSTGGPGAATGAGSTGGTVPDSGEAPGTDAEPPATDTGAGTEAPGTGEGTDTGGDTGTGEGTDTGTGDGTDTSTDTGTGEGTDTGTDTGTDEGTDTGTGGDTGDGTTTPPADTAPATPSTATSTTPESTTTG